MDNEKEILRKQIDKQTKANINSGGQKQRCPPCTYGEKVELTAGQKKKVSILFGEARNNWKEHG